MFVIPMLQWKSFRVAWFYETPSWRADSRVYREAMELDPLSSGVSGLLLIFLVGT